MSRGFILDDTNEDSNTTEYFKKAHGLEDENKGKSLSYFFDKNVKIESVGSKRSLEAPDKPLKRRKTGGEESCSAPTFDHFLSPNFTFSPQRPQTETVALKIYGHLAEADEAANESSGDGAIECTTESVGTKKDPPKPLTNEERRKQRARQIWIGKNTESYRRYIKLVPKTDRQNFYPSTPDIDMECSKRRWYGILRVWRRDLHKFDKQKN